MRAETFEAAVAEEVRVIGVPAFADNYLWLITRGPQAVVVDPGDADAILHALNAHSLQLAAILVTHHHADHVGGVASLAQRFGVPVHGPALESIPARTHALDDGAAVRVLGIDFTVLAVPGHTRGHIAYVAPALNWLFCGDTLFAGGCGRLFEGTPTQMAASLERLAALPPSTRVFCAHEYTAANLRFARAVEPDNAALAERAATVTALRVRGAATVPSTLADELATNPFLRCRVPAVRNAADARAAGAGDDPVSTFAAIREWKDTFR